MPQRAYVRGWTMSCRLFGLCVAAMLAAAGPPAWGTETALMPVFGSGFGVSGQWQGGVVSNLAGGIARGSVGAVLFVGGISWSSTKAGDWSGGKLVADVLAADTGNPEAYVGDTQGVSSLTIPGRLARLYKLYVRQRWRQIGVVRTGLLNANDYFGDTGVATGLFNASFGIFPTISGNLPGTSTYPYSSLGIIIGTRGRNTRLRIGVFGADAIHPWRQPLDQGQMIYAELDQRGQIGGGGSYTLKGGAWDNAVSRSQIAIAGPRTHGFYGIGEYRWRMGRLRCGTFLEGGSAQQSVDIIPWYLAGGVRIAGWLSGQPDDALTIGINRAGLADAPHAESVYEITASFHVYRGIAVQPDLQVIMHPSGVYRTAVVGGLRLRIRVSDES